MEWNDYYCPGGQHENGLITEYHFKHGYIKLVNGRVIGGEVGFKDGNTKIDIFILGNELSIFRPSTQLYGSKCYATINHLRTGHKSFTKNQIENILNKSYKQYKHVEDFMQLARDIFYSQDLDKQFNYKGEYIL